MLSGAVDSGYGLRQDDGCRHQVDRGEKGRLDRTETGDAWTIIGVYRQHRHAKSAKRRGLQQRHRNDYGERHRHSRDRGLDDSIPTAI